MMTGKWEGVGGRKECFETST